MCHPMIPTALRRVAFIHSGHRCDTMCDTHGDTHGDTSDSEGLLGFPAARSSLDFWCSGILVHVNHDPQHRNSYSNSQGARFRSAFVCSPCATLHSNARRQVVALSLLGSLPQREQLAAARCRFDRVPGLQWLRLHRCQWD
jgi:hypothetical protein